VDLYHLNQDLICLVESTWTWSNPGVGDVGDDGTKYDVVVDVVVVDDDDDDRRGIRNRYPLLRMRRSDASRNRRTSYF